MRQYLLPAREVHITPPQREPMRHVRKLFTFLEEEEEIEWLELFGTLIERKG